MGKRQPAGVVPLTAPGQQQQGAKTFTPGEAPRGGIGQGPIKRNLPQPSQHSMPRRPDVDAIKKAIAEAKTLEEIERLNKLLQAGTIPGFDSKSTGKLTQPAERDEEVMELIDV